MSSYSIFLFYLILSYCLLFLQNCASGPSPPPQSILFHDFFSLRRFRFHCSVNFLSHGNNALFSPLTHKLTSQAHRIVSQVVITGARVFGRAFTEAYKQASASSKYASEASKGNMGAATTFASSGLTLDEACRILNVKPPQAQGGEAGVEQVMERFKKLFDLNDPQKGGGGVSTCRVRFCARESG